MRLASGRLRASTTNEENIFGVVDGAEVVDLRAAYSTVIDLLVESRTPEGRQAIDDAAAGAPRHRLEAVALDPPIPRPERVICVGANYRTYIDESTLVTDVPDHPLVFTRFASSLVGHGQALLAPMVSEQLDFEGELAVIIGAPTHRADPESAMTSVAAYSCFMDGTVRDFQRHTSQFTPGKNFDRSGAWGPWLVTADDVADPHDLDLRTVVDDDEVQSANTSHFIFSIGQIVSYCSMFTTLSPGDVIATGTPGGVGDARNPPRWLRAGSKVTVDIAGVGTLTNVVEDARP